MYLKQDERNEIVSLSNQNSRTYSDSNSELKSLTFPLHVDKQ